MRTKYYKDSVYPYYYYKVVDVINGQEIVIEFSADAKPARWHSTKHKMATLEANFFDRKYTVLTEEEKRLFSCTECNNTGDDNCDCTFSPFSVWSKFNGQ